MIGRGRGGDCRCAVRSFKKERKKKRRSFPCKMCERMSAAAASNKILKGRKGKARHVILPSLLVTFQSACRSLRIYIKKMSGRSVERAGGRSLRHLPLQLGSEFFRGLLCCHFFILFFIFLIWRLRLRARERERDCCTTPCGGRRFRAHRSSSSSKTRGEERRV